LPLGIGYLAAVLEENQYEVNVMDCQSVRPTQQQLEAELSKQKPDIVGVTASTLTFWPAVNVVKTAKRTLPNVLTILGGSHVTALPQQTLESVPEADIVVRGEGERTMLELADYAANGKVKKLGDISGLTYRHNGEIVNTANREFIQNLDELPFPAYKHFPLENYRVTGKMYLPIITSRGCPFECTFCLASKICGTKFRVRSPKKVLDELEWLRDTHHADVVAFYDDSFTFDRKRAQAICAEMKKRKFNLPWDCRTRVDLIDKEILSKLLQANCLLIHFGVESGSQKMLDAMKKHTTVEKNAWAIKLAKEVGISVAISVVVGYPGETEKELKQTFDFIKQTSPDFVYVCQAIPYPGTELLDILHAWAASKQTGNQLTSSHQSSKSVLSLEESMNCAEPLRRLPFTLLLHAQSVNAILQPNHGKNARNHLLWRMKYQNDPQAETVQQKRKRLQQNSSTGSHCFTVNPKHFFSADIPR
jgi:radical SAM superfamily enzyme YgiQ (UPF0313 family)